jgi:hypothetical protein
MRHILLTRRKTKGGPRLPPQQRRERCGGRLSPSHTGGCLYRTGQLVSVAHGRLSASHTTAYLHVSCAMERDSRRSTRQAPAAAHAHARGRTPRHTRAQTSRGGRGARRGAAGRPYATLVARHVGHSPHPAAGCASPAAGCAPPAAGCAPSAAGCASSAAGCASSAAGCASSAAGCAPSAAGCASSAAGCAPSAAGCASSLTARPFAHPSSDRRACSNTASTQWSCCAPTQQERSGLATTLPFCTASTLACSNTASPTTGADTEYATLVT